MTPDEAQAFEAMRIIVETVYEGFNSAREHEHPDFVSCVGSKFDARVQVALDLVSTIPVQDQAFAHEFATRDFREEQADGPDLQTG